MEESCDELNVKHGRFLTLSSPTVVPLAPSSFQIWSTRPFCSSGRPLLPASDPHNASLMGGGGAEAVQKLIMMNQNRNRNGNGNGYLPPSDGNVYNNQTAGDDSGYVRIEAEPGVTIRLGRSLKSKVDAQKLKRIISNRISAHKSRVKRIQYVSDLENKATELEAHVALLAPQVALFSNRRELLQLENQSLHQRVVAYRDRAILTEAEIVKHRAEVQRLTEIKNKQRYEKMVELGVSPLWQNGLMDPNQPVQLINYLNSNQDEGPRVKTYPMNYVFFTSEMQAQRGINWEPPRSLDQMPNLNLNNQYGSSQTINLDLNDQYEPSQMTNDPNLNDDECEPMQPNGEDENPDMELGDHVREDGSISF